MKPGKMRFRRAVSTFYLPRSMVYMAAGIGCENLASISSVVSEEWGE
jgi:hypothetical protein